MADKQSIWKTQWTLLRNLGNQTPLTKRQTLQLLSQQYWRPIFWYIRCKGYPKHKAEDLTQGFFYCVLKNDFFERADPEAGPFRRYILAAVKRFLAQQYRNENTCSRKPDRPLVSINRTEGDRLIDGDRFSSPEKAFHHAWVAELLDEAMNQCRQYYQFSSDPARQMYWGIFNDRVLRPILDGEAPLSLPEIADKYGLAKERLSSIIVTVKRRLRRAMHDVVRRYTVSQQDAAMEMEDLIRMLE